MRTTLAAALALISIVGAASAQTAPTMPTPPPAGAQGVAPDTLLPSLVEHSRHVGDVEDGRVIGEAGDFLRALGGDLQFVLIGEEHGNAGIADFIAAYWSELREAGYGYMAAEIDPWTAQAMERELRAGGVDRWRDFLAARGGATAAPFFTWEPEVRLAQTIVETTSAEDAPNIWGIDQVFLGGVSWMLGEIAASARDPQARAMAATLAGEAGASVDWLGRSDAQPLIDLRGRLNGRRDRAHAALVDAMLQSQRIYRPFTGGGGEGYFANAERETLMKRTFLERYRTAERANRASPRVLLKFGSYHMYRGATPTHVQGLGGFVSEFALQNGTNALSIHVACGPGGVVGTFDNPSIPCAAYFAETWSFLAPYVDPTLLTVFDLRVWRLRPRRWQHLPTEMRQLIDSYDLVVFPPATPASDFLPGLATPALR